MALLSIQDLILLSYNAKLLPGTWQLLPSRPSFLAARILEGSFTLSHWPRAMWWSADKNNKEISKSGAAAFLARFGPILGPGWG